MPNLKGKVAVVTGASQGIGRAIAERLGRDGASVVVNYSSSPEKAQEVVRNIEAAGSRAVAVQADVSHVEDIRRVFKEAVERFGGLDILVNNAGFAPFKSLDEVTEEDYDKLFATNTRASFFAMQEAARHMREGGRIIQISSSITGAAMPGASVYAGTKGAVEQFVKSIAAELGERGITVNAISPGATDTQNFRNTPKEAQDATIKSSPLKRVGQPQDIADVVAFLAGEEARWITGQNIRATGGAVMS